MSQTALRPAHLWVPERIGSYGDEAADLARLAGRELDPEQVLAVDAMLSYGPGGKSVALESVIMQPRQNGKSGGCLLPIVLFDLFLGPADRIVWTAHLFRTARDAFADIVTCINRTPELSKRVKRVMYANGEESIELHSGARLEFLARSKGGGRGLGGNRLIMDEALYLSAESMGALIPTLSARADPQINYASSGAYSTSDQLQSLMTRGRAGGDPSLIYVEYRAPGSWDEPGCMMPRCSHEVGMAGCALDDEDRWRAANPALGRRITLEYVRRERRAMPPREFGRERLGWEDASVTAAPIPPAVWATRGGAQGRPEPPVAFGLSASWPDAEFGSIAVAGRNADGELLVQLIDRRPGTAWIPARVQELVATWAPVAVVMDDKDPVVRQRVEMENSGIELTVLSTSDAATAFAMFLSEVSGDAPTLRHYNQPELATAVSAAQRRPLGDGWTWAKRGAEDISPVVAATAASWGHAVKGNAGAFFASYR